MPLDSRDFDRATYAFQDSTQWRAPQTRDRAWTTMVAVMSVINEAAKLVFYILLALRLDRIVMWTWWGVFSPLCVSALVRGFLPELRVPMVGVVHLPTALRFASGAVFKLPAALATFQLFEASLFAVQVVLLAAYLDYPLARVRIALVAIGCVQAALLMFVLHHEVLRRNTATHDTGRWCSKAATMAWAVTALLLAQTALLAAKLALAPHLPWGIVFCPLCGLAAYGLVTCAVQLRNFLRLSTSTVDEDDYAIVFQAICDLCFIAFMLFFVADSTDTWQVDWLLGTIPLFLAGLAQLCVVVATRIVPLVAPEPEFQAL